MGRRSHRDKLIVAGLRVVHQKGFGASSVRDIVSAAKVPQGSFTNHFASKEQFGIEIIEAYHVHTSAAVAATLRNDSLPPLARLRMWIEGQIAYLRRDDMRKGCLYGNMSAEASEHSAKIRARIAHYLVEYEEAIAYTLDAAIAGEEISAATNVADVAGFILSSLEGAILVSKAYRSPEAMERVLRVLFDTVLAPPPRVNARANAKKR